MKFFIAGIIILIALSLTNQGDLWQLIQNFTAESQKQIQSIAPPLTQTPLNSPTPTPTPVITSNNLLFGINPSLARWYTPDKGSTWENSMVQKMKQACATIMRTGLDWAQIEPNPPVGSSHTYIWNNFDHLIDLAINQNIQIIGLIVTTPSWASGQPTNPHLYPPLSSHTNDYVTFLTTLINRYKGKIKYYEFWNEANGCGWYPACTGDKTVKVQQYLPLLKITYNTIKSIDPTIQLSTTGMDGADSIYLSELYAQSVGTNLCNGKFCWDAVAVHPYNSSGPINFSGLDTLHTLMLAKGDSSKIWITEYGWDSSNESQKSNYLTQTLNTLNTPTYSPDFATTTF